MKSNTLFITKLDKIYPKRKYEILEECKTLKTKILIKDKYGFYRMRAESLLQGNLPSMYSAIDKTKNWINRAREIHGDTYDYSLVDYVSNKTKIKIICLEHGVFEQRPINHLQGKGCKSCGTIKAIKKDSFDTVVGKANKIHNNFYLYNKISYINSYSKLNIICPIHGYFEQSATNHLQGNGCPKCSIELKGWSDKDWEKRALKSKNFDSFKVYVIRCWNDEEEFYKIGKTFTTIKERFKGKNKNTTLPYNYKIVKIVKGNVKNISKLERQLHKLNKDFIYLPKIKFNGHKECFKKVNYD